MTKITVLSTAINVVTIHNEDYICITDMLKAKDGDFFIHDWLRNRNTLEYLGIWEKLYNPDFNYGEFAIIRNQAGLNSFRISVKEYVEKTHAIEADVLNVAMFGMTAQEWREANPDLKGNIRDYATINELICLSNMENLNAVFIHEGLPQKERLLKLNQIAIQQMQILEDTGNRKLLK